MIRQCISKVNRKDNKSSPITRLLPITENRDTSERVLTYDDICDFMMTKHKTVKVDKVLVLEFRDALARNDSATQQQEDLILNENEVDEDGQVDVMMMIHQEASTYEGIRSAVAFLLGEQHMTK